MKQYELLYIVSSTYSDADVDGIKEKIEGMIKNAGATILRNEKLGKLKLAYPIKHQKFGTYVLTQFDVEPAAIQKLDQDLRLMEDVLRHLVTERLPGAEKKKYELKAYEAPLTEEGQPRRMDRRPGRRSGAPSEAPVDAPIAPRVGPEMSMEELDKKLDKILEGSEESV